MKANVQENSRFDGLKWAAILVIAGAAVWANVEYASQPLLYRVIVLVLVAAIGIVLALQTAQGLAFWELAKAARTEIRKVVWPTRQETTQTTLVVVGVVLVMALILWGLDTLLGWLASLLIG